jgi:hypothetical protein
MARDNKPLIAALIVSFTTVLVLVAVLLFVLMGHSSNKTDAETSNTAQTQSNTNGDLQGCINDAHGQWDGLVASGETMSPNYAQSDLDQAIATCHQQYGY